MKYMDKKTYFAQLTHDAAINEISNKTGLSVSTLWRQYNKGCEFSAESVIIIARAYGENPVAALVEFGYIRADEMENGKTVARLHDASNDELLQELARRLKENADADWVNSPIIYREEFDMAANDDPNARLEAETPED
mgnify:FL=1